MIRSGGGLGESWTPRQIACSPASSVGAPGNSEATWPSGPMPSTIRSSTGRAGEVLIVRARRARAAHRRSCARPPRAPARPPCGGPARDRSGRAQQRLGGQPVVAFLVLRPDAALVGEPHLDAVPVVAAPRRAVRRCAWGSSRRRARGARRRAASRARSHLTRDLHGGARGRGLGVGECRQASSSGPRKCVIAAVASWQHRLGGPQRGPVGGVAQQRLTDALAEDAGLAARGAEDRPFALVPLRVAVVSAQAARPAVQAQLQARTRCSAARPPGPAPAARAPPPGAARCLCPGPSLCRSGRRRRPSARRSPSGRAPSPGARPASRRSSIAATVESGWWRTVTASSAPSSARSRRGSNAVGDPLAPRGRAQPGEIDDVGAARRARRRARSPRARRARRRVEQHRLREPQQRVDRLVVAVGRPQQGRQVAHDERVGDRQQVVEVAIAELDDHGLVQQRELARAWGRLRRRRSRARPGACGRGRRRARSGARRGSARRRAGGWRSRRSTRARRRRPC